MATIVFFHAHPDDEVITTGGSIARAADEGHRVVLVIATDGAHGESPADLKTGETLADRRRVEAEASAAVLGAQRVAWLGYGDSGMTGWEQNDAAGSFHRADVDEAAARLASIVRDESADLLTSYDWHGNYGHPDHIKVHRVANRAAELVEVRIAEATANRDAFIRQMTAAQEAALANESDLGAANEFDPAGPADDGNPFGMPEAELTLAVDVTSYVDRKRRALACHRSQISDSSFFMEMPDDIFTMAFGTEWYIEHHRRPPHRVGWLLD